MARALPTLFPSARVVHDVGGGPGVYLTGFRNMNAYDSLVTVEPSPRLDGCGKPLPF